MSAVGAGLALLRLPGWAGVLGGNRRLTQERRHRIKLDSWGHWSSPVPPIETRGTMRNAACIHGQACPEMSSMLVGCCPRCCPRRQAGGGSAPRPTCRCGSSSPGLGCARTRAAGSPGPRAPRPQIQANVGTRNFARSRPHGPEREGLPGSRLRPQLVTPRAVAMALPARDIPPAPAVDSLRDPNNLIPQESPPLGHARADDEGAVNGRDLPTTPHGPPSVCLPTAAGDKLGHEPAAATPVRLELLGADLDR